MEWRNESLEILPCVLHSYMGCTDYLCCFVYTVHMLTLHICHMYMWVSYGMEGMESLY